eukprot:1159516-Pelagomonas_calceolata.AAC.9
MRHRRADQTACVQGADFCLPYCTELNSPAAMHEWSNSRLAKCTSAAIAALNAQGLLQHNHAMDSLTVKQSAKLKAMHSHFLGRCMESSSACTFLIPFCYQASCRSALLTPQSCEHTLRDKYKRAL